jgi:hypothetical protein
MHSPSSSLPSARQSDRFGTNKYLVQHREILSPEAQTGEGPVKEQGERSSHFRGSDLN